MSPSGRGALLRSLVLLSTALLLALALDRSRRRAASSPGAFHFPTADSHAAVSWDDPQAIAAFAEKLQITEADLRSAMTTVGNSENAIRSYFGRLA